MEKPSRELWFWMIIVSARTAIMLDHDPRQAFDLLHGCIEKEMEWLNRTSAIDEEIAQIMTDYGLDPVQSHLFRNLRNKHITTYPQSLKNFISDHTPTSYRTIHLSIAAWITQSYEVRDELNQLEQEL